MRSKIKKMIIFLIQKRNTRRRYKKELRDLKRKKFLYESVDLSPKQEKEIQEYFLKNLGKKFSDKWHRLYQSYTGNYDKKYFPESLYSTKLEAKLNPIKIASFLEDKSLIEILYKNVENLTIPETIVVNCSGIYYNSKREIISYEEAIKLFNKTDDIVFKTTIDSCSGRSINIYKFNNGIDQKTKISIAEVFDKYQENFIAQKCITNCEEIKKLHPNSLNTFRIMTYTIDGKMYHAPLLLRIGRGGNKVDNAHAGGMFIGVSDDGKLKKFAYTEYGEKFDIHPDTKIKFENYQIPMVKEMIKTAYICHGLTPHLKMISWDFAIGKDNKIVLIEINTTGQSIWLSQIPHGCGIFKENTEYMYNLIKKR